MNKLKIILPLLLLLFSCNTNKEPYWVTEPPADDDFFIYIVAFSEDGDTTNSVIEQLADRYGFDSVYIPMILKHTMSKGSNDDITNIDEWVSDVGTYRLVRIKRSYLEPIFKMFVDELELSLEFISDFEDSGDFYYKDGDFYKAYELYLKALKSMLEKNSDFYIPGIIRTMDKVLEILNPITLSNFEYVNKLTVGKSLFDKDNDIVKERFYFDISGLEGSYNGFLFNVNTNQGWDKKEISSSVPIINNSFEFIPPVPKVSGEYYFNTVLNLKGLTDQITSYSGSLESYFSTVNQQITTVIKNTTVQRDYSAFLDLEGKAKLISFNPQIAGEGVVRRLLEDETTVELASFLREEESLEFYIRELDKVTEGEFYYLIYCDDIDSEALAYDGDILFKTTGTFKVYEIDNYHVVHAQKVSSEFIITPGEEDIALLDFGLKVGEVISSLEF